MTKPFSAPSRVSLQFGSIRFNVPITGMWLARIGRATASAIMRRYSVICGANDSAFSAQVSGAPGNLVVENHATLIGLDQEIDTAADPLMLMEPKIGTSLRHRARGQRSVMKR
jgi:hypothetical protein